MLIFFFFFVVLASGGLFKFKPQYTDADVRYQFRNAIPIHGAMGDQLCDKAYNAFFLHSHTNRAEAFQKGLDVITDYAVKTYDIIRVKKFNQRLFVKLRYLSKFYYLNTS